MSYFIIIRGALGIGKSTIAMKLCSVLDGDYISVDEIIDENNLDVKSEDGFISEESFLKANEIILEDVRYLLKKNKIVILDGCFYRKAQIEDLKDKLDFDSFVFTLKAKLNVCIERDANRDNSYGEDAATVVHNIVSKFDYGEVINAENKTEDEVVKEILSFLPK